ncbi:MAG: hypothetical protein DHS20C16_03930 [Phycisphaerae bacterium]|nr:MAG: hypothetical protein DHS20C16_03930 [Phycisphaerae bacterium]
MVRNKHDQLFQHWARVDCINRAVALLVVALLLAQCEYSFAQAFTVPTVIVPASDLQVGGPVYDYDVGITEVTNTQFAAFLNDAEFHNEGQHPGFGNERGNNLKWRPPPIEPGDVGLVVGDSSDVDAVYDMSRGSLLYNSIAAVGTRYTPIGGKEDHPAIGMSWIGAVKFCNWLTIDQGFGLDHRCYAEGSAETDWFPITTGIEIDGTQESNNLARDLNASERAAWVRQYRGYRLLMDEGGTSVGASNAVPRRFNEWYKAAAFDPAAPDTDRTFFVGFPFEAHSVPADHWLHAFGRDPLTNLDANFRDSGDPFDNPDPAVYATTPACYYDGTDHDGAFQTAVNNNRYGICDMSGNVWEFLSDQVTISASIAPDRSIAGGSYRSNNRQVTCANRGDVGPGSTRPVIGLRVMRVTSDPCSGDGDSDLDGDVDLSDYAELASCLLGPAGGATTSCACFDNDSDGDVDLNDFSKLMDRLSN